MEFINSYRSVVHDYLLEGNNQPCKLTAPCWVWGCYPRNVIRPSEIASGGFGVQNIANC